MTSSVNGIFIALDVIAPQPVAQEAIVGHERRQAVDIVRDVDIWVEPTFDQNILAPDIKAVLLTAMPAM